MMLGCQAHLFSVAVLLTGCTRGDTDRSGSQTNRGPAATTSAADAATNTEASSASGPASPDESSASSPDVSAEQCGAKLADLLALQSESDVEIAAAVDFEGMYRVFARVGGPSRPVQEIFATRGCTLMTDRMVNIDRYREDLRQDADFINCLMEKRVGVFGVPDEPATSAQLAVLGAFAGKVLVPCTGEVAQRCTELGITSFPTVLVQGQAHPGPLSREAVQALTGCGGRRGATPPPTSAGDAPARTPDVSPQPVSTGSEFPADTR